MGLLPVRIAFLTKSSFIDLVVMLHLWVQCMPDSYFGVMSERTLLSRQSEGAVGQTCLVRSSGFVAIALLLLWLRRWKTWRSSLQLVFNILMY